MVLCDAEEPRVFTLRPGDNRFGDKGDARNVFDFTLPNGLPARARLFDAGFHEVSVHAAVNPKGTTLQAPSGLLDCDAYGSTWIERETRAYMQTSPKDFHCKNSLLKELAELEVKPQGFGDRGRVIV